MASTTQAPGSVPSANSIDDLLVLGAYPQTPEHYSGLVDTFGIAAVLSLQSDHDLAGRGISDQTVWTMWTRLGVAYERVPITDFDPRDLSEQLEQAVATLDELVSEGLRTYVHCTVGINRSSTVLIAHLVRARGMSLADAEAYVRAKRPQVVPYLELVESWWAKRIRRGP